MLTDNFRILVDWDGDGFVHSGVPTSAPANLVPNPYFMMHSNIFGTSISGREEPVNLPEVVKDVDYSLGFQYAKIPCGGVNSKQVWAGYRPRHYAQPLPSEIQGTSGSTLAKIAAVNPRWVQEKTAYGEYVLQWKASEIQSSGTFNYVGSTNTPNTSNFPMTSFPVVAGTVYRISFWHRMTRLVYPASPTSYTIRVRIGYHPVTGTPTFTQTATHDVVVTVGQTWVQDTITFTAPVGQTFTVLKIEGAAGMAATDFDYQIAGVSIYPTASNPTYVADPAVTFDNTEFFAQLEASTAYNYSFYVKADTFTKIGIIVQGVPVGTATWSVLQAEQQTTLVGGWQRVSISFTTGANSSFAMLQIIPYVGASPASAGVSGNLYVRAFQLTKGATLYPMHTNLTSSYDDISDWVTSFDWKFGKNSLETAMPYEGTLDININNDSMIFSPANTASPLYTYIKQARKVLLQIKHPTAGTWSNMWAGWLDKFDFTAGRTSNRDAKFHCQQGVFRFRMGKFSVPVTEFVTFSDIVRSVIDAGSWRSVGNAYEGVLDFNQRLDDNSYIADLDADFASLDDGINTYDLQGLDWGRNTTTEEALNDILGAENAGLWIDREGLLNVRNRNYWVARYLDPDVTLSLDNRVQSATYVYGDEIVNSYEVEYQPKQFNTNEIVWQSKRAEIVPKNKSKTLALVFSLPEGRIKTVANIQSSVTLLVYAKDPVKSPSEPAVVSTAILNKIASTVYQNGSRYYLEIRNDNADNYYVKATITGDALNTGDKLAGNYNDEESMNETLSLRKKSSSNPIISSTEQAEAVAIFYVSRSAFPIGEFKRIEVVSDHSVADYTLIKSLSIGSIIKMSETQTHETASYAAVVEEAGSYSGNVFRYKATLDKLDPLHYYKLDVGTVESSNGAINAFPIGVRGAVATDAYDGDVPIKVLSTFKRDGHIYLIDNPYTVRSWNLNSQTLNGDFVLNPVVTSNLDKELYDITNAYLGAVAYTPLPTITISQNLTFNQTDAYITGNPYIVVEPSSFYQVYLNMTRPLDVLPASTSDYYQIVKPFGDRLSNKVNTYSQQQGLLSWWRTVAGVKTFEGDNGNPTDRVGISFDATSAIFRIHTDGHAFSFTSPITRTNLGTRRLGLYLSGLYKDVASNVSGSPITAYSLDLINMSGLYNMSIDSTKTYKFAIWLRTAPLSVDCNYTLELLDKDHVVVATATGTPNSYSITKIQASLASGYSFITARLRKTSVNTEMRNDAVWMYGCALTEETLTYYTDIPQVSSYLYI